MDGRARGRQRDGGQWGLTDRVGRGRSRPNSGRGAGVDGINGVAGSWAEVGRKWEVGRKAEVGSGNGFIGEDFLIPDGAGHGFGKTGGVHEVY